MTRRWRIVGAAILFAMAVLLAFYSAWGFVHAQAAVTQALEAGQLTTDANQFEIASYLMSNSGDYVIVAITFGTLGWLLLPAPKDARQTPAVHEEAGGMQLPSGDADDDLDDLLSEMPPETHAR